MAESNGSLKAGNGAVLTNGNGMVNGHSVSRRRASSSEQTFLSWAFGIVARLATWAAILTVLFRCPSSLDACDDSAPYICKPYFQVKNAVSPHVQPYYDQYAAPYVEIARPYYETADARVWKPTRAYAVRYGAPWVEHARAQAWAQWEKNGQPQVAQLQGLVQSQYDRSLGPYVTKANDAVGPYYDIARTNTLQLYYEYLLPGYEYVHPYMAQGYDLASNFTTGTALPGFYWTWNKTHAFLDTAVWPHVRAVYSENVEPQLIRIGERLGRYKTREKAKTVFENNSPSSATDAAHSSFSRPPSQSTPSLSTSSEIPAAKKSPVPEPVVKPETKVEVKPEVKAEANPVAEDDSEDFLNPVQAPPPGENESEKRRKAREMVAHDLDMWQNKFARQADDGANDMDERVDIMAKRMIRRNARTAGKALLDDLRSTIDTEINALKAKITSFVESGSENSEDMEEQIVTAVRSCGMIIKSKAQAIREWREDYDEELQSNVLSIADIHFQILDETRNLALQQIGMRWAWTDGVTYKDWAKYHELKSTLSEWTEQLKQLVVTHPTLLEAQDASAQVEDDGMEIASAAARELARLKNVARWKIVARDATENFESEAMQQAAEAAEALRAEERAQVVLEANREHAAERVPLGDAQSIVEEDLERPTSDKVEDVSSAVSAKLEEVTNDAILEAEDELEDYLSLVSEPVAEATSSVADAAEVASEAAADYATIARDSALFESEDDLSDTPSEAASAASETIASVFSDASSLASESAETLSSVVDEISSTVEALSSSASESVHSVVGEKPSALSEAISSVTDKADTRKPESVVADASESVTENAGATAENLGDPLAEDDEIAYEVEEDPLTQREETSPSDTPEVKPAFLGAAAQEVPDRQPILDDYVDTDAVSRATDAAQAAYSSAVSRASEHYSSAVSVVSAQMYGTPKPVHEKLFSSVSSAYDHAVAAASSKLDGAVEAASAAVPATPTLPTLVDWQRVESIAAQRLEEGRLWAEIQYQSALIALGLATPTPSSPMEKYYEQARLNYFAGLGIAQDQYSSFMAGASSALSSLTASPTPTDMVGSASSVASVARESVASAAQAAGDAAGSALSAAGDTIASATQAVDDSVSSVVDAANEQISGAGEAVSALWVNVVAEISANIYQQPSQIAWHESILSDAGSYAAAATEAAESSALAASEEASRQYAAVSELVSELIVGKEPTFTESVLSRLGAAYSTAAANVESMASEASEAASSIGDKVGSAAGKATDAVKETVEHLKDEL